MVAAGEASELEFFLLELLSLVSPQPVSAMRPAMQTAIVNDKPFLNIIVLLSYMTGRAGRCALLLDISAVAVGVVIRS